MLNQNFLASLETFLGGVMTSRLAYFADMGLTYATPEIEVEAGDKFIKILHCDRHNGASAPSHHSVVAFVATRDFSNGTLGDVKEGDVFKSASYKAPAKHKRGNLFDADFGLDCYGAHGPNYLR